jgi:hypothetical protein
VVLCLGLALLGWTSAADADAQETSGKADTSREAMRGLDEQVQEIKSDVLSIATELSRLEEKLLFPSDTQVSVFISLAESETFRLDAVQLEIDEEPVARHVYSFKELEALRKGGVQRIFTGNVRGGAHALGVSVSGQLPSGDDFTATKRFDFDKDVEPKLIELTLSAKGDSARIELGRW